jgi:signal transduction histidine kinase
MPLRTPVPECPTSSANIFFEPFARDETSAHVGTGLGLYLSHTLAARWVATWLSVRAAATDGAASFSVYRRRWIPTTLR